tara:strand:+ start:223 stop:423 length:201 start_codon:yes stop_codon:yes gene_type:complete
MNPSASRERMTLGTSEAEHLSVEPFTGQHWTVHRKSQYDRVDIVMDQLIQKVFRQSLSHYKMKLRH